MYEWLKDVLLWVPQKLWEMILSGLASVLESIPVPSWLTAVAGFGADLPPGVGYLLHMMQVPQGLSMMLSAYVLRFLIRRLPVVG